MLAPHSARLPLLALSLAPVRGPALVPFSLALSDAASEAKVTCQVMGIICARAGGPVLAQKYLRASESLFFEVQVALREIRCDERDMEVNKVTRRTGP